MFGPRLNRALDQEDWLLATRTLLDLVDTAAELSTRLAPVRREAAEPAPAADADAGDAAWKEAAWKEAAARLLEEGIPALQPTNDALAHQARQTARAILHIAPEQNRGALQRINTFAAFCAGQGATIGARQDLLLDVLRQLLANVAVLSEQASWVPGQVASVETLIQRVDAALYRARREGKNRVVAAA